MSVFPLLFGTRLRATKINSCGLPIAGPANRLVTDGFIRVTLSPQMRDANEVEQTNAEGKVCVFARTTPQRKYYNCEVELCNVNTGLMSMFSGWPQVLNWADEPVGFRDQVDVDSDYGVAIEVWTGGRSEDECPLQVTDDVFANPGSGKSYGYVLFGGTQWRPTSDITVTENLTTVTMGGMTLVMSQWGRGPYNVVAADGSNTPCRLLEPLDAIQQVHVERTPIPPPDVTAGDEPEALAVASIFLAPDYYFGGPGGAPAADVAPDQPVSSGS